MKNQIFKDLEHQEFYDKNGYIVVDMLSEAEMTKIKEDFSKLKPSDNFVSSANSINKNNYHCTFLDTDKDYKKEVARVIAENFDKKLEKYLVDYKILTANFYVKQPNKGNFEIHQNWPTLEKLDETSLTIWAPLHDTFKKNGTIHVVPGSHKLFDYIETVHTPGFFKNYEKELIENDLIPLELKEGQAVIFCDTLIHWSPINNDVKPRIAIQIETIPKQEQGIMYYYDKDLEKFAMYAVDKNFFIENTVEIFFSKPTNLKLIGYKENPNKNVDYAEFKRLVKEKLT